MYLSMPRMFFLINIFMMCISHSSNAQNLRQITEIDINTIIKEKYNYSKQVNIKYSNKKNIGQFLCIKPHEIIDSLLKINSISEFNNIIIRVENNNYTASYSYYDFSFENNKLAPYILLPNKAEYRAGDTVNYLLRTNKQDSEINLSELDKQFNHSQVFNLFLQFSTLDNDKENVLFKQTPTLVFPIDKSVSRWMQDIKKIKLYIIE